METNSNNPVNISEFKALIERYETITYQEVKEEWNNEDKYCKSGFNIAGKLTGYGRTITCKLCISCKEDCHLCVYKVSLGCINISEALRKSYNRIDDANSPVKLFNAFRNRAKVLREYAKDNEIDI